MAKRSLEEITQEIQSLAHLADEKDTEVLESFVEKLRRRTKRHVYKELADRLRKGLEQQRLITIQPPKSSRLGQVMGVSDARCELTVRLFSSHPEGREKLLRFGMWQEITKDGLVPVKEGIKKALIFDRGLRSDRRVFRISEIRESGCYNSYPLDESIVIPLDQVKEKDITIYDYPIFTQEELPD